ncbi:transcription elongation factor GreA [Deferrisoma camini]|uniref:transcription elongation factor GreA n=1 Tax=Deferrisoma camini TaxID=1035120 RepID=UPI00046D1393|nr:transcription elongation factor GreA [Deferrisoma camini]
MSRMPITRQGYSRLREELERLKKVDRVEIVKEIQAARAHGDISENAEYHAAREKQGWIEAKIRDLETKLAESDIVDPPRGPQERVRFGVRVRLEDLDTGEEKVYEIVGPHESDVNEGRISITSPLARALLNKEVGDDVEVDAPRGVKEYEILEIEGLGS